MITTHTLTAKQLCQQAVEAGRPAPPLVARYYDEPAPRTAFRCYADEASYYSTYLETRTRSGVVCELCGDTYQPATMEWDYCRCQRCSGLRTDEMIAEAIEASRREWEQRKAA